jgi:hypothetical protein
MHTASADTGYKKWRRLECVSFGFGEFFVAGEHGGEGEEGAEQVCVAFVADG